jgi:hypothetical protein
MLRNVRRRLKKQAHGLGRQRGQALILFVGVFTIIAIAGAAAVDFGLWLSERRGAQTDSDLPALAGAWELLDQSATATDASDAVDEWLLDNEESGNTAPENVVVDNSCFGIWDLDAVAVDVSHESRSLFASIVGLDAPDIGAHAKACAGSAEGPGTAPTLPFETDLTSSCFSSGQPNIGGNCIIEFGAQGPGSQRGYVDVTAGEYCSNGQGGGGSGAVIDSVVFGAQGTCIINQGSPPACDPNSSSGEWYDCIASQPGNSQAILLGVRCRITGGTGSGQGCPQTQPEPLCDLLTGSNGDGIDDFSESTILIFDGPGVAQDIYEPRDCNLALDGVQPSPRVGAIFVLPSNPTGNNNRPDPIIGFAGFYLQGCKAAPGNQPLPPGPPTTTNEKKCIFQGNTGHLAVWGTFVNLTTSGGGVGPPNPASTLFGIGLVE